MHLRHAAFLLAAGACVHAAAGAPLADPTQPPARVAPAATAATAGEPAPPSWPRLQSVQVGAAGGASALLDGRLVHIGDRVGALTVVAIDHQGVLLRGPHFAQRLALTPGISKAGSLPAALPPVALPKLAARTGAQP
ncbi:hypothetical protein HLB44_29370 [Aquincola sp. S2]|uniref:MSHA biogenesis protein MshK n=1 Tax=Pseudaquabacterium terrae TaxID=2732868 RepID=A0ABX2ERC8_9BURK|nr:hypothetical protein [Aquabacterium terrae]NRF71114.1 hypothetical protein [Aquabacterium terrae]